MNTGTQSIPDSLHMTAFRIAKAETVGFGVGGARFASPLAKSLLQCQRIDNGFEFVTVKTS